MVRRAPWDTFQAKSITLRSSGIKDSWVRNERQGEARQGEARQGQGERRGGELFSLSQCMELILNDFNLFCLPCNKYLTNVFSR